MISDITKRVKSLMIALGYTERAFSERLNIPQTTLNSSLKSTKGVSMNVISLILDTFQDVSAEWLMRGKGEMFIAENSGSSIVINNTKHTGNGDAITGSNVSKAHTIADEHYYRTIIAQKEEQLAAKDKRINELTDHIIQLATTK